MKDKVLAMMISLLLYGCTTCSPCKLPAYDLNSGESSLAEASYAVSHSIVDLAETAQAAHPLPNIAPPPPPAAYGMGGLASIDWSGPIEPVVRQIACAANYRVHVLGTAPAIPVLVTVFEKNAMLGDILRDVGYQGGRRATVLVFPESRLVEIRYAKN